MSAVAKAWAHIGRIKHMAGPSGTVPEAYGAGETWMMAMLDEHGLGGAVDELADIVNENARVTLTNALAMDREALYQAALIAGIAREHDPRELVLQVMTARLMHSAGFANGLALGLELGRRE